MDIIVASSEKTTSRKRHHRDCKNDYIDYAKRVFTSVYNIAYTQFRFASAYAQRSVNSDVHNTMSIFETFVILSKTVGKDLARHICKYYVYRCDRCNNIVTYSIRNEVFNRKINGCRGHLDLLTGITYNESKLV